MDSRVLKYFGSTLSADSLIAYVRKDDDTFIEYDDIRGKPRGMPTPLTFEDCLLGAKSYPRARFWVVLLGSFQRLCIQPNGITLITGLWHSKLKKRKLISYFSFTMVSLQDDNYWSVTFHRWSFFSKIFWPNRIILVHFRNWILNSLGKDRSRNATETPQDVNPKGWGCISS